MGGRRDAEDEKGPHVPGAHARTRTRALQKAALPPPEARGGPSRSPSLRARALAALRARFFFFPFFLNPRSPGCPPAVKDRRGCPRPCLSEATFPESR